MLRKDHTISRKAIPDHVLMVLKKLHAAGFQAYLVGGCVRDLLLNHAPKDFDVATNARPDEIKGVFRNCRLIGRRFRLAHIYFKHDVVEVATFRAYHGDNEDEGMVKCDNVYGSMEEDAFRRDFTINALYYTTEDCSVIDYTQGLSDLQNKLVRMIGDPETRYKEDPVRILRAIRFISKINFALHKETERPIFTSAKLLEQVSSARLFHEALKIFHGGYALACLKHLKHYQLIATLLPEVNTLLNNQHPFLWFLLETGLHNTDMRIERHQTASPAFLFAMLLWYPMIERYKTLTAQTTTHAKMSFVEFDHAMQTCIKTQNQRLAIPKQLAHSVQEIWRLQPGLENLRKNKIASVFQHPRFRAAYDLLLLRHSAGEETLQSVCQWWTDFIAADDDKKEIIKNALTELSKKKRRRKKNKKTKSPESNIKIAPHHHNI